MISIAWAKAQTKDQKGNKKENALKSATRKLGGEVKLHSFRQEMVCLLGHLNQMEIRRVLGVGHHRWKQVVEELKDLTLRQKRPQKKISYHAVTSEDIGSIKETKRTWNTL